MKRLLLAATLGLTTLTANAVCPASLSGKYAGSGEYTEQLFINGVSVLGYMEYHLVSVTITGSSMIVEKEWFAGTGTNGPATAETPGVTPFTFDKNTCTGMLGNLGDPLFFVVTNSGLNIRFIHGKNPRDKHLSAETWELNKQ
jgi:hypothetical protein